MPSTDSPLVVYTKLSPHNSGPRTRSVDRITPHCTAASCDIETLGNWFAMDSTRASSNYGIDRQGRVGLFVPEAYRSWCTSSNANDQRAVTIECSSAHSAPNAIDPAASSRLIELCVDICQRHGKTQLLWISDRTTALAYEQGPEEMLLTVHRWFSATACPGNWLMERMQQLADTVTSMLAESAKIYRVQVGAYRDRSNAERRLQQLQAAGIDGFIVEGR